MTVRWRVARYDRGHLVMSQEWNNLCAAAIDVHPNDAQGALRWIDEQIALHGGRILGADLRCPDMMAGFDSEEDLMRFRLTWG